MPAKVFSYKIFLDTFATVSPHPWSKSSTAAGRKARTPAIEQEAGQKMVDGRMALHCSVIS